MAEASSNDAVVRIANLTKIFRDFWHRPKVRAVEDLSFEIRRGEVFGLLGPNGSGKSTTVKLLLNLLFPTSGGIRLFDLPPTDSRVKARIGFLPEETYVYPYLNAYETLSFFGRLNNLTRPELRRRVPALIEMIGLSSARNRPLREYSKGMARRIGIGQALINDPELLLLDEPTTGLDPIGTREVKDLILNLKSKGKTVLLCSHLLADVEDVCDRIGILHGGRLCALGTVEALLSQQQITQVSIPDLSEDTLQRIERLVEELEGAKSVEVGHPVERLESFFLRVIREARVARPETGGAGAGRFQPDLFAHVSGPEGAAQQVIGRLLAPEPSSEAEAAEQPPSSAAEAQPAAEVLDRLVKGEAEPEETPESPPEAGADEEQKKREVLGRLVQDREEHSEDE